MDVLSNKNYRSYDYISRYQQFPYFFHKEDNKYVYGTTAQLDDTLGYSLHIVKPNDTIDSIALEYYNNPTLYWIICDFNRIQDPFIKLKVGDSIKVPIISSLQFKQEN